MDDYLAKPVRSQALVEVLERWTGESPRRAGDGERDMLAARADGSGS
jgi:YesN/AraC family two-component response regulator